MKKKVLVVVDRLNTGGIAAVVLNISKAFEKKDVSFDYICYEEPINKIKQELYNQGSKIFIIERLRNSNPIKYINNIRKIIKENNKYDVIHVHTSLFIWLACYAAKKEGIKVRIGHAHGSKFQGNSSFIIKMMSYVCKILNRRYCSEMLTCAETSGKSTFGYNYKFIPNFIDHRIYEKISQDKIEKYYKELDLPSNSKILTYIGYIGGEKNTSFLVPVFRELLNRYNNDCYLVIVGDGSEFNNIKKLFERDKTIKNVRMLGQRQDVDKLLNIVDILLMPSFSEGMSIALLEAQMSGVRCLVSKGVPMTNSICDKLFFKCNEYDAKKWANFINDLLTKDENITRREIIEYLKRKEYDIDSITNKYRLIYNNFKK